MAGMKCLKFMLCAFNLVFWAAGIAVMAVGIFARVSASDYTALTGEGGFQSAANIMIAAGALVMLIGIVGCCGAIRENKWLLLLYFFLVLLIFVLEVAAGILAYTHKDEVIEKIENAVNVTVRMDYGDEGKEDLTKAIDSAQQKLECCGVHGPKDWSESSWKKKNKNLSVPESCCKTEAKGCNQGAAPNIYKTGCSEALQTFVKNKMSTLGGIGVGIAIIQILGMIFAICMFRSIGYEKI